MTQSTNSTYGPVAPREPSFHIEGKVTEVLRGCGVATIHAGGADEFTVSRGTQGVHFEELRIGQKVSCQVALPTHRVLHAHQQTQPMHLRPRTEVAWFAHATKDEFIAEHCRQWGVAWSDISKYRVVVPASGGEGWVMANVTAADGDSTSHGSLESLLD